MEELRKLLNDLDTKAKEVKEQIDEVHPDDISDDEYNLQESIFNSLENLEYSITQYQEYKKWI